MLTKIENLSHLKRLHTLNLAENRLTSLDGLEGLDCLKTLDVRTNLITDINECKALKSLPSLTSFDARNNQIANHEDVIPFFEDLLINLELLYLIGNPFIRKIPNYRKIMISTMPTLIYFDERQISAIDRKLAEAFVRGGKEEELRVRDEFAEGEREKKREHAAEMKKVQEEGAKKRKAAFAVMMEKVKSEKAELITRKETLQTELDQMRHGDSINLFRPYKMEEISDVDKEMKVITFEKLLSLDEPCPEGLRPHYITDGGRGYMEDFVIAAKKELAARKPIVYPTAEFEQPERTGIEIEEIYDEPPEMEKVEQRPPAAVEALEALSNMKIASAEKDETFDDDFENEDESMST